MPYYGTQPYHQQEALAIVGGVLDGCIDNGTWVVDISLLTSNPRNLETVWDVRDALEQGEPWDGFSVDSLTDVYTLELQVNGETVEIDVSPELLEQVDGCNCNDR